MTDDAIRLAVEELLAAWSGWPTLNRTIDELPDLHVYLAGGVMRDVLLGNNRPVKDFDFFLGGSAIAQALDRLALAGHLVNGPFGSPRWYPQPDGSPYSDLIPIEKFQAGLWPCEDIVDVLNQFDCTINAVAIDLRTAAIYDPQNGRRDAERRVMRAVRFDRSLVAPSRIGLAYSVTHWYRFVHYASVLGLEIEPVTLRWLRAIRPSDADARRYAEVFSVPVLDAIDVQPLPA
jgi:hypothetical protein